MHKGVFEFEVGEPKVKRGFKFGTYAFAIACEKDKCILSEILHRIGVGVDPSQARINIMSLLHVFYGAAVHYTVSKKIKQDFDTSDVSDWLDELGLDKVNEILTEGLTQYAPKNSTSLAETGETVTP
jgi:hypothetical protein